jgi:hypothetical protein
MSGVLAQAVFATDFFAGDGFRQARKIGSLKTARLLGMIQVKGNGTAIHKFPAAAKMVQSRTNVGILTSPTSVILIKAINRDEIITPEGHVATDDSALFGVATDNRDWPADALGETGDFTGQHPAPRPHFACFKPGNKFFPHKATAALDPKAPFGESGMVRDELGMRHTISICENEVVTGGDRDGFIQDNGFAKTVMRLPDVLGGN